MYDVAFGEPYEKDGEDKKSWHNIGTLFVDDEDGRMSIKLHSMPAPGVGFNGWLSVFEQKPREGAQGGQTRQSRDVVIEDIEDKPIDLSEIPF